MSKKQENDDINNFFQTIRFKENKVNYTEDPNTEVKYIKHLIAPKEGGIYTEYEGFKYLRKGVGLNDSVTAADNAKKVIMAALKSPLMLISLVFHRKPFINALWQIISFHRLKPERYCPAVQEVYKSVKNPKIRDIACVILEFDDAYRYRFQDACSAMGNKFGFYALFYTLWERERVPRLVNTWFMLMWVAPLLQVLTRLKINPKNVIMDEADMFWAKRKNIAYTQYDWGGKDVIPFNY